jgi:hypothetical protein
VWIVVDSMDMKIVHIVTSNGKADPIAVGKVKKTSFHGIHYIINTMESMNTNHLNKRNPNKFLAPLPGIVLCVDFSLSFRSLKLF